VLGQGLERRRASRLAQLGYYNLRTPPPSPLSQSRRLNIRYRPAADEAAAAAAADAGSGGGKGGKKKGGGKAKARRWVVAWPSCHPNPDLLPCKSAVMCCFQQTSAAAAAPR